MRLARGDSPTVFATGGKENELKVWNFEDQKCVFTAKNVRIDLFIKGQTGIIS